MATREETIMELQDHLMALRTAYADLECEIAKLHLKLKDNMAGQCEMVNRMTLAKRKEKRQ